MFKKKAIKGLQRVWDNFKQAAREVFAAETKAAGRNHANYSEKTRVTDMVSDLNGREMNTAFVTESTRIVGSIITDSDIVIAGEIQGDVESTNTVVGLGKVLGNIKCKDAEMSGAYIEGDIAASEMLTVGKDSVIVGDLSANDGMIAGKIKGNIDMKSDVQIAKEATVLGDISASSINVERGAVIQGSVKIRCEDVQYDSFDFVKNKSVLLLNESEEAPEETSEVL